MSDRYLMSTFARKEPMKSPSPTNNKTRPVNLRPSISSASTSSALPPALTGPFFNCTGVYQFDPTQFIPLPALLSPLIPYLSAFPFIIPAQPNWHSNDSLVSSSISCEPIDLFQSRTQFHLNSLKFSLDKKFRIQLIDPFSIPVRSHVTAHYLQLELEMLTEEAYDLSASLTPGNAKTQLKAAYAVLTLTLSPDSSILSAVTCFYDHSLLPHSFPPPQPDFASHPNLRFVVKRNFKRIPNAQSQHRIEVAINEESALQLQAADGNHLATPSTQNQESSGPAKLRSPIANLIIAHAKARKQAEEAEQEMREEEIVRATAMEGNRSRIRSSSGGATPAPEISEFAPSLRRDLNSALAAASNSSSHSGSSILTGAPLAPAAWYDDGIASRDSISVRPSLVGAGRTLSMASAILTAQQTPIPSLARQNSSDSSAASAALAGTRVTGVWRLNRSLSLSQSQLYDALQVPFITRKFLDKVDVMMAIESSNSSFAVIISEHFSLTDHTGLCHQSFAPQRIEIPLAKESRDPPCAWIVDGSLHSRILTGEIETREIRSSINDGQQLRHSITLIKNGIEIASATRFYEMPDEDESEAENEIESGQSDDEELSPSELTQSELEEDAALAEEELAHRDMRLNAISLKSPIFTGVWSVDKNRSNDLNKFSRLLNMSFMNRQSVKGSDHLTVIQQNAREVIITEKSTLNDVETHFPLDQTHSWRPMEYLGKEGHGRVKLDTSTQQLAVEFVFWTDRRKIGKKITQFTSKLLKKDEDREGNSSAANFNNTGEQIRIENNRTDSPPLSAATPSFPLFSSSESGGLPVVPDGFLLSRVSDIRQLVNRHTMRQVLTYSENEIILCIVNRYFIKKESIEERQLGEMAQMRDKIHNEKLRNEILLWENQRKLKRNENKLKRKLKREKLNNNNNNNNNSAVNNKSTEMEMETDHGEIEGVENENNTTAKQNIEGGEGIKSINESASATAATVVVNNEKNETSILRPAIPQIPVSSLNSPAIVNEPKSARIRLPKSKFSVPFIRHHPEPMKSDEFIQSIPYLRWLMNLSKEKRIFYWAFSCFLTSLFQSLGSSVHIFGGNRFYAFIALISIIGLILTHSATESIKIAANAWKAPNPADSSNSTTTANKKED